MGVGGGFIMVPAMIYLLRIPTNVVVGTSLFQIIFTTAYTTVVQAATNYSVDIVLAFILMLAGVVGAQYGVRVGQKLRGDPLLGAFSYADIGALAGKQTDFWRQEFIRLTGVAGGIATN